jgi:hypothetical protein
VTASRSLGSVIARVAGSIPGVDEAVVGSTTTWSAGGRAFAILDGDTVELRLDDAVAAAAIRTPDVTSTPRGSEWVRYSPRTLEGHDLDRLEAWLALAHRRAMATGSRA